MMRTLIREEPCAIDRRRSFQHLAVIKVTIVALHRSASASATQPGAASFWTNLAELTAKGP